MRLAKMLLSGSFKRLSGMMKGRMKERKRKKAKNVGTVMGSLGQMPHLGGGYEQFAQRNNPPQSGLGLYCPL